MNHKQLLLDVLAEMDGRLYEIEQRLKKLGEDDNMDVFWLCEHIKDAEELVKTMEEDK